MIKRFEATLRDPNSTDTDRAAAQNSLPPLNQALTGLRKNRLKSAAGKASGRARQATIEKIRRADPSESTGKIARRERVSKSHVRKHRKRAPEHRNNLPGCIGN
jgi:hypothetical protein